MPARTKALPVEAQPPATRNALWVEVRHVLALAIPVALAEMGWISMNVVDTIMIGSLGPVAIGAIAIGGSVMYPFGIFGIGLLLGLDTLVAQAHGAGQHEDGRHSLVHGVYLALLLTPLLMLLFYVLPWLFPSMGIEADVASGATVFLRALSWCTLPLLLYAAFRRYLQATGHAKPVMFVLITANLINWLGNWLLIRGHGGFPALGVAGSAYSTVMARLYMGSLLAGFVWWFERRSPVTLVPLFRAVDWARMLRLVRIGLPAATQILLEIGAFAAAALLAGRLSATALAAHQIAINVASVSYMVPLGISSAAAVTVGHALGFGQAAVARKRGFIALGIASAFALAAASLFALFPYQIMRLYTSDPGILEIGKKLLSVAAMFQLFDGLQAATTGALRGLGDTKFAMLANLAGYWAIGLPIGYLLCFTYGQSIYGIWYGLTLALVLIAVLLLAYWHRLSRRAVLSLPAPTEKFPT